MTLWVQVDVEMPDHDKTHALADLLQRGAAGMFEQAFARIDWRARAIALLVGFWTYVARRHPNGDVTAAHAGALEEQLGRWLQGTAWAGQDVRELLVKSGHVTRDKQGKMRVRNWSHWSGATLARLQKERKRKQLERAAKPGRVRGPSTDRPALEKRSEVKRSEAKPNDVGATHGGDPLGAVPRYRDLQGRLLPEHHGALEGYVRAAAHPGAVVAGILAEGPDTGTQAQPGVTWAHVGQALHELQMAGKPFGAALFRGFVASVVTRARVGLRPGETPADQMRQAVARAQGAA